MTVTATSSRVEYAGNGATVAFTVPFYFLENADLKVYKAGTLQTITTHYTVSGAGNPAGGTVTFLSAPAVSQSIVIFRDPAMAQDADYVENDPFPAQSHERALDKLTMIAQRIRDLVNRSFRLSDSDTSGASTTIPTPAPYKLIGWNSAGTELQNYDSSDIASAVTYSNWLVQTFAGDGSTTTFTLTSSPMNVANTDVSIDGVTQVPGLDYTIGGSGLSLVFGTAPSNGSVVCCRYGQSASQGRDDASIIYYLPDGALGLPRTVQGKLREVVSVFDYIPESQHLLIQAGLSTTDWTHAFDAAIATGKVVIAPAGVYEIADIGVVDGMDVRGEKSTGSGLGTVLKVRANNSGAFTRAAGIVFNIKFSDMSITAKTGVTGARAYKQADKGVYTAYAEFNNIETFLDLQISYDGFFIFTSWEKCRDGYAGNAVGGQTHHAIDSVPAAFGQPNQTNINQVVKCQFFRSSYLNGVIDIAYGANWTIKDTDFESCSTRAVNARGIYGLTFNGCWFESLDCAEIVVATLSPAPNPQGTRPVMIENSFVACHANNTQLVGVGGASEAGVRNVVFANAPAAMTISNAPELTELSGVYLLSGSPTNLFNVRAKIDRSVLKLGSEAEAGFINSPYTQNQNILPIGPNGLGASNFTLNGFTAAADIASQIGLPSNAVRLTLSGSGNAAYYNLPAKIVKFLRGKTITFVFLGYGSGGGSENLQAAFWEDIGSPSFANISASTIYSTGLSYSADITVGAGKFTVGASATTLAVGFTAGGNGLGQTYAVESAKLLLGDIKATSTGFN